MHTSRGRYTHTGRQDTGGGFVKVESPHAPHAVGDERQHITAKQEASVKKQAAERHSRSFLDREEASHFSSLQRDDHLVIGDKVRLRTVERDLHLILKT